MGAFVPLSSVAAFCFGMYLPAMLGGTMVSIDSWQPDLALRAMAEHEVRWTMLVPTMALQLAVRPEAEGRLAGLTAMTVGGGPMNADALGRAERTLGTTIIRVFGGNLNRSMRSSVPAAITMARVKILNATTVDALRIEKEKIEKKARE